MAGTATTGRVEHRSGSEVRHLRLNHNKVIADLETLRAVLGTDGGTDAGGIVTLLNELHDDHAIMVTFLDELDTDSAITSAWETEVDGDLDDINDFLDFEAGLDGPIGGDWTVTVAGNNTLDGAGRIKFRIDGQIYECALDTTITLGDDGDVDDGKWRAWRVEIIATGIVTAIADGDTQHTTEDGALAGLAAIARTGSSVEIGYFTIHSNTGYAVGESALNGETAGNWRYNKMPRQRVGLTANMGAPILIGDTTDRFQHGTIDCVVEGVKITQIAASAGAGIDFTAADTITGTTKFGGHLITVSPLDGTTVMSVPADGVTDDSNGAGVSDMTYGTAAAANTALDLAQDRIPSVFPIFGRIVVDSDAATFTYGTTTLDGAGGHGTGTFTSETYVPFDRTDQSGTGQGVDQPVINATVGNAFLAAGVGAANVVALGADKLSATTVNLAADMTAATVNA